MALKRTFEPRKHELSGEVRFNRAHDDDHTQLWRQTPGATGGTVISRLEGERDVTDALTRQFTAQTDYVRTLGPHVPSSRPATRGTPAGSTVTTASQRIRSAPVAGCAAT